MALPGQGLARLESHVFHVNHSGMGLIIVWLLVQDQWVNSNMPDHLNAL
jgi:hypothetical protein